ncbi:MAG: hypothetical protein M0Q13_10305 [Methanothrix sp.]|jgi:hypothetical protein|nr:hypothetical protein [Methanothrix sp.]
MISDEDIFFAEIVYIFSIKKDFSNSDIRDILCVADIDHFIKYGRTINDLFIKNKKYKFDFKILNKILDERKEELKNLDYKKFLNCLSKSDIQCLDYAINRQEVDFYEFFYSIEKE